MFKDRNDAGHQLAKRLLKFKGEDILVLGIPRGGIPVAEIVAKYLKAPLNVALSKKIGHPFNKEYAIGAVSLENSIIDPNEITPSGYIAQETAHIREILGLRYRQYYKNVSVHGIKNKTVIIIDDGIATGNTMALTVELVAKQHSNSIIVAVPVAPAGTIKKLRDLEKIREVVCLETPKNFRAVGQFYEDFEAVTDSKAISILEQANSNQ
ncbi:phosphoribosyltransferase [Antarcticibacterium arcticum]|uniref:Phosphoribosyltransferase n=1 Tax=Antarcticibacterium arcticum TaxID=2585771 RepID=A0A5B8YJE4_9FLAO|nr:phosphoribosyltransferase family protein [Antarcticibacterium arcticum]QED37218.1 phosphoribosyltransferase [Antarcticibacterium arcticum]